MRLLLVSALALSVSAPALGAKPAITSSEETYAQVCIDQERSLDRLLEACTAALSEPSLTTNQRADLLVALGDVYSWQDDDLRAKAIYEQALELNPLNVTALNGLGWVVRVTDGDAAAMDVFERSLASQVTVQGLAGKASTAREVGAIDGATSREMLRAALAIDPTYLWALREIAWSLHEDGDYAASAAAFEEALAQDADDDNALYGLARVQLRMGEPDAALENLNRVVAGAPEHFAALVYRVIALRDLDRNAQALREADRVIEIYPNRTSGYIEKGLALMALERRAEAIETFAAADTKLGPDNALLYWYADSLIYDGRLNEAMGVIDRAIALEGANHSDYLLKSYIALELENYPVAKQAAQAALGTGVNDPWAHYYIAITLVHDGDMDGAMTRFAEAMEGGLPGDRVGAFASELVSAGKFIEAAQLRLKY